jgi:predicted DNA-binding transcriptional regulator AlpA
MFGGVDASTLYQGIRAGRYPAPIKIGPNISRWLLKRMQRRQNHA